MTITGEVVKGKQIGRLYGAPTANIILEKLIASGIFVGRVSIDNQVFSAAVFVPQAGNLLEAHLLDYNGDLYGKTITVEIGQKVRDVQKFENEVDLIKQISLDIEQVKMLSQK
ncbi:MAG: riboflavin kinase [Candidatus Falkowbacteria bacterium]